MAYNPSLYMPYGQQSYPMPQYQQPMPQVQPQPQPFDLIIAVSGRNGAEAFQMPPNSRAVLFDDKEDVMYRVSTDGAGYKTVTEFDFSPRSAAQEQQGADPALYVPRSDFEVLEAKVAALESLAQPKTTRSTRKAATDGE